MYCNVAGEFCRIILVSHISLDTNCVAIRFSVQQPSFTCSTLELSWETETANLKFRRLRPRVLFDPSVHKNVSPPDGQTHKNFALRRVQIKFSRMSAIYFDSFPQPANATIHGILKHASATHRLEIFLRFICIGQRAIEELAPTYRECRRLIMRRSARSANKLWKGGTALSRDYEIPWRLHKTSST